MDPNEHAGLSTLARQHMREALAALAMHSEPPALDDHNVAVNGHEVNAEA